MNKDLKAKIGIFSLTLLSMSSLGITPSISLIAASFPENSLTDVQQLTAIPNFMAILAALFFSVAANKIPRKVIAMSAPIFVLIGGLVPVFFHSSLMILLVCSAIMGIGVGFVSNITQVLITELVSPENRQATMSQNVIFVNIGSIIMTMGGGALASGGWTQNYLIYLVAVPVLIAVALFIPMYKNPVMDEQPKDAENAGPKPHLSLTVLLIACVMFSYNFVYSAFPNNVASVLMQYGLADETTVSSLTGTITAVGTVGGIVAGFCLPYLVKYVQKIVVALGLIIMGVGMLVIAFVPSSIAMFVAAFCIGFALSVGFAQCPFLISISSLPMLIPMGMAAYSIGSSLGGTVSPTIINAIASFTLGDTAASYCAVAGIFALVVAAVLLVTGFQAKILANPVSGPGVEGKEE